MDSPRIRRLRARHIDLHAQTPHLRGCVHVGYKTDYDFCRFPETCHGPGLCHHSKVSEVTKVTYPRIASRCLSSSPSTY